MIPRRTRTRSWIDDLFEEADVDRLHVFMPVVMSVGLFISVFTLARDAIHRRRWRSRARRTAIGAHLVAAQLVDDADANSGVRATVRPTTTNLGVALTGVVVGVGVIVVAATEHFDGAGGLPAWAWAAALVVATAAVAFGAVAGVATARHDDPPPWTWAWLSRTPLGRNPDQPDHGDRSDSAGVLGLVAATAALAALIATVVAAAAPSVDHGLGNWLARQSFPEALNHLDAMGKTQVVLVLAAIVGIATLRCSPFAIAYVGAVLAGFAIPNVLRGVVPRVRPDGAFAGARDSFPSGHMVQSVIVAGLLPVAVAVITRRRWAGALVAAVLVLVIALDAAMRVHEQEHWPTDVVAGVCIGAAIVATALFVLSHRRLHAHCHRCPWSGPDAEAATRGVLPVSERWGARLRWAAAAWAFGLAAFLALAATRVGLPRNPEGDTLGSRVEGPVQLGLVMLYVLGATLGLQWPSAGAVLLALAAVGLGLMAGVEYAGWLTALLTLAAIAPALLLWLSWQRHRRRRAVVAVAVVTGILLVGSYAGASSIYSYYWGPTHPESSTLPLPIDRVEWAWSGLPAPGSAVVVAHTVGTHERARLALRRGHEVVYSPWTRIPDDKTVRLAVDRLTPGTRFRWRVDVDGHLDRSRGRGTFTTSTDAPETLTVAVASCARTGSNGSVFDAIRATHPDLYIEAGDLHYQNIDTNDISAFRQAYRMVLTAPAQAALYRHVPVAYVWDDHDYGGNDADASSPSRPAARRAFRQNAPHGALPLNGPIAQAFSMGRVRFILTDLRSERRAHTMLGARQQAWLEQELTTASATHDLVVWVSSDPWIARANRKADDWAGFASERRAIADVIARNHVDNLVMLAGDVHMVAIDDGTHSDYATGGGAGFPVLHGAALDRHGNAKGGPYSEGAIPGSGQFGLVRITNDGTTVGVTLEGRNWKGEVLMSYHHTVPVRTEVG